jgi:hypothetical protein
MWLQVHVEEPSAEAALRIILPKLVPETQFEIITYQGKQNMLRKLPNRMKGLAAWSPKEIKVAVLVDRDDDDCYKLKSDLEAMALDAGLATKSAPRAGKFYVVNRLAIEELEAWFFGDTVALHEAFSRIPVSLRSQRRYRDPDAVPGGTWESLERLLKYHGYYHDRMPKIEVARRISAHMDPVRNRSKSFQVFRDAVLEIGGRR